MASKKASVLVVDDDERMLRLMTEILQAGGYGTTVAADGEGAIKAVGVRPQTW